METDLALAAGRAVASVSDPSEWLTLKAAISMTTQLIMCACPLEMTVFQRPAGTLHVCSWLAGWRGTRHHRHSNADQHQGVFQHRTVGVLASRTCRDVFSVARWDKSGKHVLMWLARGRFDDAD